MWEWVSIRLYHYSCISERCCVSLWLRWFECRFHEILVCRTCDQNPCYLYTIINLLHGRRTQEIIVIAVADACLFSEAKHCISWIPCKNRHVLCRWTRNIKKIFRQVLGWLIEFVKIFLTELQKDSNQISQGAAVLSLVQIYTRVLLFLSIQCAWS
jgi:hypothetical protein